MLRDADTRSGERHLDPERAEFFRQVGIPSRKVLVTADRRGALREQACNDVSEAGTQVQKRTVVYR